VIDGRKIGIRCTSSMGVQLGPRVTPLAVSSGGQRIPQPSNRRATLHRRAVLAPWLCSDKAANRGYATVATDVVNAKSIKANSAFMPPSLIPPAPFNKGGVERPSNIMSGIMRSRQSVTSARRKQQRCASHTLPPSHNLHYIKCPQPPRCGFIGAASRKAFYLPPTPKGAYRRAQAHKLFMASAVPQLAHFVCCVPRPTTRGDVPWFCCSSNVVPLVCHSATSSKPRAVGLVGGCPEKKSIGGAERVKAVSDRVCQRAQRVKVKSHACDAGATLTRLRALAVVNH